MRHSKILLYGNFIPKPDVEEAIMRVLHNITALLHVVAHQMDNNEFV
jgi:hypothetical protein